MASIRTQEDDYGGGYDSGGGTPIATGSYQAPAYHPSIDNGGISGYGRGVETPPMGGASPYSFNQSTFEDAFRQATSGRSGSLAEYQQSIFPMLQQQFPDIQSFGSKGDKIRLPNGQVIDAVISAGAGGRGYGLNYDNPTSGYFSDPLLQGYLDFGQGAIGSLMGEHGINPVLQQAIAALTKMSGQGAPHMDMSYLQPLQAAVTKRQGQIDKPGYSPAQQDIMRTQISDPLEAQRDAARQQVVQHFAAKGFGPDSGVVQQALLDSDRSFSQMRTTGERNLATNEMAQDEARQQEAVQMNQILSQLGLSGSSADLQGQIAGRGQNLSAAGQLGGIGSQLQDEPFRNLMAAMGISGNMAQLPFQSMSAAQSAMGSIDNTHIPQADSNAQLISLLMGLANQGEGAYQDERTNGNSFWTVLGTVLPDLLKSFGGLFGEGDGPTAPPHGQY